MSKIYIKRFILIFLIINIISILFSQFGTISFASSSESTYTQTLKSGIDYFPEEYKNVLTQLKTLHPNWNFEAYYTGINWDTVISSETSTHGRNRIIKTADASYKCSCGNVASGYACASEGIVKYYLDPRNFLNEVNIFQFLEISYNDGIYSLDGINSIVKNTFLDASVTYTVIEEETVEDEVKEVEKEYTKTYSEIIMEAAKKYNMSPYSIVIKIIQEVGTNGSESVKGTYSGYTGYYNFFNLGAYDTGNAIVNGLKYAQSMGWSNQYIAIMEGTSELARSYTNAGQNTAYFYKWDVVGTSILKSGNSQEVKSSQMFSHQYMTNVQDPTSQSKTLYNTYAKNNILDKNLNFIIPIYNNMPTENLLPSGLTSSDGTLYYVNCTDGLTLRANPTTSASKLGSLFKDTLVIMLEKECVEADGYKWDKIKLSNGVIGYVADKYLTLKEVTSAKTSEEPNNTGAENKTDELYKCEDNIIVMTLGITIDKITGAVGEIRTGAEITIGDKKYVAVVLGDPSEDGEINSADLLKIVKHLKDIAVFSNEHDKKAADVNQDGEINSADLLKIVKYLKGTTNISL